MKQIILSSLVVGMGVAWLYVFATTGMTSFYVTEPSMVILLAETLLFVGIVIFGVGMFVSSLRGK